MKANLSSVFPMDTRVVADFMVALASITGSKSSPALAKAAIRYYHGLNSPGVQDPTESRMVTDILKCVRKTFSKEVKKSHPISSEEVAKLLSSPLSKSVNEILQEIGNYSSGVKRMGPACMLRECMVVCE